MMTTMTATKSEIDWVHVDVEVIRETEKAVLVDFGAARGCVHQAWIPKSHFFGGVENNFHVTKISRRWMNMKSLWKWSR